MNVKHIQGWARSHFSTFGMDDKHIGHLIMCIVDNDDDKPSGKTCGCLG